MTTENWIDVAALTVSFVALAVSIYALRAVRYDIRAHKRNEEALARADLRLRLERHPDRVVVRNHGGAEAKDVHLQVVARGRTNPVITQHAQRKLPLPRLGSEEECAFDALVFWEAETMFDAVVTWRDPNGKTQKVEQPLYV